MSAKLSKTAIRTINPNAVIYPTERADVDLKLVLDRGAFDLTRILENDPDFLSARQTMTIDHAHDHGHAVHDCGHEHCDDTNHHNHHHVQAEERCIHTDITSVSLRGKAMNPDLFFPWINKITQIDGPDILRLKGIIAFDGDPERYVIQGIHMIVEGDHQRAWKDDETRESRLVFIGTKPRPRKT